jgi:uncharacterized membrane protein
VLTQILTVIFLLLSGALAGVLFTVTVAVVPVIRQLPGAQYAQVHQMLDKRFDPMMPHLNKVSLALCVALAFLVDGTWPTLSVVVAGVCIVGVAVVSERYNVRINRAIDRWDPECPPADWTAVSSRWARANHVRTVIAIAGFGIAITGVVVPWS